MAMIQIMEALLTHINKPVDITYKHAGVEAKATGIFKHMNKAHYAWIETNANGSYKQILIDEITSIY